MSKYDTELKDFPNIFSLKGKVVVITGGSRGLGLHAASGYSPFPSPSPPPLSHPQLTPSSVLQAGAHRVYISSRKTKACDEAVKALNALPNLAPGAKAIAVPADISTIEGVESLVAQVKETTDFVDCLFANAGASEFSFLLVFF